MTDKNKNYHNIPKQLLIEVQYRPNRDRSARLIKGQVTGKGWGRWRYGEKGVIHIGDAEDLIVRGWFIPLVDTDYRRKLNAFKTGRLLPDESTPVARKVTVEGLRWVGDATAKVLAERGVVDVTQIAEMTPEALQAILKEDAPHLTDSRAKETIQHARKVLGLDPK